MTIRKILSALASCGALLIAFGLAAHDDRDRDHDRDHERLKARLIGW